MNYIFSTLMKELEREVENNLSKASMVKSAPMERVRSSYLISENHYEKDDSWVYEFLVPGFEKEEIKISFDRRLVRVDCKHGEERKEESKILSKYKEIKYSFYLPDGVAEEKVKASLKNSILTITFPKDKKEVVKTISVE